MFMFRSTLTNLMETIKLTFKCSSIIYPHVGKDIHSVHARLEISWSYSKIVLSKIKRVNVSLIVFVYNIGTLQLQFFFFQIIKDVYYIFFSNVRTLHVTEVNNNWTLNVMIKETFNVKSRYFIVYARILLFFV